MTLNVLFIFLSLAGLHNALLTAVDSSSLHCNDCSSYSSGKAYPGCLRTQQLCQQGHACTIIYKPGVSLSSFLTMGCTTHCINYTATKSNRCEYGGNMTSFDTCFLCCKDNDCIRNFRNPARGIATPTTTSKPEEEFLYCPVTCLSTDVSSCQYETCPKGKYCNLAFNVATGNLEGQCASPSLLSTCQTYDRDHHCPAALYGMPSYLHNHKNLHGYCYLGCCKTNACVRRVLSSTTTTTAAILPITTPSTTTKRLTQTTATTATTTTATTRRKTTLKTTWEPTTLPTPTVASYNYSALMTSCADKLSGSTCSTLRSFKNICHDPIGATLCPDTCDVCKMVRSVVCEDKAVADECVRLSSNRTFCQGDMAMYVCAKSCNLCNTLVKSVVDEVLYASPTPDFNQPLTTPPTFHCPELLQSDCVHVRDVCKHTNLDVICPKECGVCS